MTPKKLTKGQTNLIKQYGLDIFDPYDTNKQFVARNPFSGAEVQMNRFMANLYRLVMQKYSDYERGVGGNTVQQYDRLKMLLCHFDSNAYMQLID